MTFIIKIMPSTLKQSPAARPVVVVVFDRFQLLDATGPAQAFSTTNDEISLAGGQPFYDVQLVSLAGGLIASSSGIAVMTEKLPFETSMRDATIVMTGGLGVQSAVADERLRSWLVDSAQVAERVCSVCTGAFVLAAAGLLDGRDAVTHWRHLSRLEKAYPGIRVTGDSIFVKSGKFYTSAGITAGIDLSLSLIEEDLGRQQALGVAKRLVVHLKRPGGQLQFSSELLAQTTDSRELAELVQHIREAPALDWTIERMAAAATMSPRSLHRRFLNELRSSPSQFVAKIRLEKACTLIESTNSSLKTISRMSGFSSEVNLKNAFRRSLGITPIEYLERFRKIASSRRD